MRNIGKSERGINVLMYLDSPACFTKSDAFQKECNLEKPKKL